jgi:hypothetical protein
MLALAVVAGWWSSRSRDWRRAAMVLGCVCLAAGGSYAVSAIRLGRAQAPPAITVDGRPFKLREGRVLLYFFNPECTHCLAVAREMSKRAWGPTRIVALPTEQPQFAADFLSEAGLRAGISPDAASLRQILPVTDPPCALALDHGRVAAKFNSGQMESETYYEALKRLGHLH